MSARESPLYAYMSVPYLGVWVIKVENEEERNEYKDNLKQFIEKVFFVKCIFG